MLAVAIALLSILMALAALAVVATALAVVTTGTAEQRLGWRRGRTVLGSYTRRHRPDLIERRYTIR